MGGAGLPRIDQRAAMRFAAAFAFGFGKDLPFGAASYFARATLIAASTRSGVAGSE